MPKQSKTVGDYLKDLRESKSSKPPQVREALEVYIDLWESAIKKRVVSKDDDIDAAIAKVDAGGGLYQAAESSSSGDVRA